MKAQESGWQQFSEEHFRRQGAPRKIVIFVRKICSCKKVIHIGRRLVEDSSDLGFFWDCPCGTTLFQERT